MSDDKNPLPLNNISSSKELNKMIHVSSPMIWLSIIAVICAFAVVITWSFTGSIPEYVDISGNYSDGMPTNSIYSTYSGKVTFLVGKDEPVQSGDPVAKIDDSQINREIESMKSAIDEVTAITLMSSGDIASAHSIDLLDIKTQWNAVGLSSEQIQTQIKTLTTDLNKKKNEVNSLKREMSSAENAYLKTITEENPSGTQNLYNTFISKSNEYNAAYSEMSALESQISILEAQRDSDQVAEKNQQSALQQQFDQTKLSVVNTLERELQSLLSELEATDIIAPYSGIVTGILVQDGQIVSVGDELVKIKTMSVNNENQMVVCFVPSDVSKKLSADMLVNITPSTVRKEEYGYIYGRIVGIESSSATYAEMLSTLGNEDTVDALRKQGPLNKVIVALYLDESTVSGFEWSSKKGADLYIAEGTSMNVSVIVREIAPIVKVFPFMGDFLHNGEGVLNVDVLDGTENSTDTETDIYEDDIIPDELLDEDGNPLPSVFGDFEEHHGDDEFGNGPDNEFENGFNNNEQSPDHNINIGQFENNG